jgi:hypothetical protein
LGEGRGHHVQSGIVWAKQQRLESDHSTASVVEFKKYVELYLPSRGMVSFTRQFYIFLF